jgi:hypothetical protein
MNPALERQILTTHPHLYRNLKPRFDDGQHFECRDGWAQILEELSTRLDSYAATDDLVITQVKQKLGSLTVYVELDGRDWSGSEEMAEIVLGWTHAAREKSRSICEVCGAAGSIRKGRGFRFMQALCDACAVVRDRD